MRVFVYEFGGTKTMVDIVPTVDVAELQDILSTRLGIPADQQRLIYGGRSLYRGRKLSEFNIEPDAQIYLVRRLGPRERDEHADFLKY